MARIINEIVWSVRFGSLANLKYSFEEMPIMKSLNIALKLIKNGLWQSPAFFNDGLALL